MENKPHIVLVVPRGEAVRNFLYSDTLALVSQHARVSLLTITDDEKFMGRFKPFTERIIPLKLYDEHKLVLYLRGIIQEAHFRWLWSEVAKNHFETGDARACSITAKIKWNVLKMASYCMASRRTLEVLTALENNITWLLRPSDDYRTLFQEINPDIVFNCSHIHGPAAEFVLKIAHRLGIPTAAFVFSWDNLTSRSRITVPYDYYFVWNRLMHERLRSIYPFISAERIFITGTPQFDFHHKQDFWLTREALCQKIGLDPRRPFILYTTGMDLDFPEEYRTVEFIADTLEKIGIFPKPQLVVRTYIKGTSHEMKALAQRHLPDVIFPPLLWDEKWLFTPLYEDLAVYTSLLRECCLGINAASTVSLELLMHDKPVINLGFDPPGSNLPHHLRWIRHIHFDHYRPVAESGAVMVAYKAGDIASLLIRGLSYPQADSQKRQQFIKEMFGGVLDGHSGKRIAQQLVSLAQKKPLLKP